METFSRSKCNLKILNYYGNLSTIEIYDQEPFLVFRDKSPLKDEDVLITGSFVNLCKYWSSNTERVYKIDIDSQRYDHEANILLRDPEMMLTDKYNIPPMDFYTYDKN